MNTTHSSNVQLRCAHSHTPYTYHISSLAKVINDESLKILRRYSKQKQCHLTRCDKHIVGLLWYLLHVPAVAQCIIEGVLVEN